MAQVFHPGSNTVARAGLVGFVLLVFTASLAAMGINLSYGTRKYIPIEQPVQFSHKHHVSDAGIDCRYCHTSVDKSSFAGIPPTETCMTCHSQVWSDSPEIKPIHDSWTSGEPIEWNRVHDLPDFVYFNHSAHVSKGVGCDSCHGNVGQMPLVYKVTDLSMAWCLDCHRDPAQNLRPLEEVYNTNYEKPANQTELGKQLMAKYGVKPANQLTNCSICHR
jgi:hypothetical protein